MIRDSIGLQPATATSCPAPSHLLPGTSISELTYSTYLHLRRRHGPIPYARLLAEAFLRLTLAEGPLPVGDRKAPLPNSLRAQAAAAGLAWGTIRRAASELNLRIFRDAECWYWQLPTSTPAQLAHATCAPSPNLTNDQEPMTNDQELTSDQGLMTNDDTQTCAPSPLIPAA